MPQLRILDSITDRGDPKVPNEDACGGNRTCAFVIDGATGLGDKLLPDTPSDAAWLAELAKDCFEELATPARSVRDVVRRTNERARVVLDEFQGEQVSDWQWPVAGFQMISVTDKVVCSHGLGDCRLFITSADGSVIDRTALPGRDHEAQAARDALTALDGIGLERSLTRDAGVRDRLRARRARFNRHGTDVWTLGKEPAAADHVVTEEIEVARPAIGLLCTDGFAALVDTYGRYDPASLVAKAAGFGLAPLLGELRVIEHREDPDGAVYPRFKRSDDATALLFEIV